MINEENQHDYITAYVYGELEGEELTTFEEKKASDVDFSIEVDIYQVLIDEHRQNRRKQIKERIKVIHIDDNVSKVNFTSKIITFFQSKKGIYATAAILLLFLSAIFLFRLMSPTSNLSPKEYALQEVSQHEQLGNMGGKEVEKKTWVKTYEKGKFVETIPLLEEEIKKDSTDYELHFRLGLCYLYQSPPILDKAILDKAIEALKISEKLANDIGKDKINQANWYIAIIYLLQDDAQKAKEALLKIKLYGSDEKKKDKDKYKYYKKAQELLGIF